MEFSDDFIAQVLHDIYRRGKAQSPTDLSPELFRAILRRFNEATAQSMAAADVPDLDDDFRQALRHSNEVFSAFKVHRMQSDMARLLTDSNGDLKPFNQWANDVLPIASHQCGAWLRTEYDTAVLRAHQAADWQQFVREADCCLTSNGCHPHRPIRAPTISYFGTRSDPSTTRSGTNTGRAIDGTANARLHPPTNHVQLRPWATSTAHRSRG